MENDALATEAPYAPVTYGRRVRNDLEDTLPKPYMARALAAPDVDHPNGTTSHNHNGMTVLQQHVAFFDQDHNGIVYPWETYAGFRAIGFNPISSLTISVLINGAMSYPTLPVGWIPSPFLPIYVHNIHKAKHGSDSGVYDTEGSTGQIHTERTMAMTEGNRITYDFFGWITTKLEWAILYVLARDEEGMLSKEAVRRCFDGSLFEYCAKMKEGGHGKMG
ncbi:Peroxygenase [Hibiscus syriacus]|uniref:Peroxygenase n=1 Tax=Hibiscus syriacus TaxID=106335 RepID=A0A6A2Z6K6_HIBSY|nr:Peroxygenase [Hibiscus syriacus]